MTEEVKPVDSNESLKLDIRTFKPEDAEEVFNLHAKALVSVGNYHPGNEIADVDFKDINSEYIKSGGEFLVGTIGGRIVAMGALRKKSNEIGEIRRMRTDPDFQRRGFAQAILDRLEARAREMGLKYLELDTWVIQTPSRELYEKNGYKEVKRYMGEISGIENIVYQKTL